MGLDVYLQGRPIGSLFRDGERRYGFVYRKEAIGAGDECRLSRALPLRPEPYGHAQTRAYVEGLLPTGERRRTIALELGVDPDDGYALIAELGRDCAGAAVFLPEGEAPEPRDADSLAWLGEAELEQLLAAPERGLLDPADERRMRFALPGDRHKLALVRDAGRDRWAWPEPGAPSTHVIVPLDDEPADLGINAMACSAALRELGLPVAHVEAMSVAGVPCLVSKRFDRWGEGSAAERLHQESFCQALGLLPSVRGGRGVGYVRSCELLRDVGDEDSIATLFAVGFCNHLLGNAEGVHGARSALLHSTDGPLLAPYPPVYSLGVYGAPQDRPSIYELVRRDSNLADLAPSAMESDFDFQASVQQGLHLATRLGAAFDSVAERAREEGWYAPIVDELKPRRTSHAFLFRESFGDLFDEDADDDCED
jgi:serine/threonine-protein kinase HipA